MTNDNTKQYVRAHVKVQLENECIECELLSRDDC